jgi:hypothetical protein
MRLFDSMNRNSMVIKLLMSVSFAFLTCILAIPVTLSFSQSTSLSDDNTATTDLPSTSVTMSMPQVSFLPDYQATEYVNQMNYTVTQLSNSTLGDANNVKASTVGNSTVGNSTVGNTTYVAWQGNINNTNHVFISVTYNEGANYTAPVRLTPPNANTSELQIFASGSEVSLVWFDYNQTTGKTSIFGSRSTDGGQNFSTYKIRSLDTDARNLMMPTHEVVVWIQRGMCGGGDGGDPSQANNIPPRDDACAHRW